MSIDSARLTDMIEYLPEEDKEAVFGIVKRLVLAWDPDYTKLTPAEAKRLDGAAADSGSVSHGELLKELGIQSGAKGLT